MIFQIKELFGGDPQAPTVGLNPRRLAAGYDQQIEVPPGEVFHGDHGPAEKAAAARLLHEGRDPLGREGLVDQIARAAAGAVDIDVHLHPASLSIL